MDVNFPTQAGNWVLQSQRQVAPSTVPNYEDHGPLRVNHEGVQNYLKHRGTLNIGGWAMEGRRIPPPLSTEPFVKQQQYAFQAPPPKVLGPEAIRNYEKSRSSTPNLIGGVLDAPYSHHHHRVKREGVENYEKAHNSQMKNLLQNYGKLPISPKPLPHTQGEMATDLFHSHKKGRVGLLLTNYGHFEPSPRPNPHVSGSEAEDNYHKAQGSSIMLEHKASFRPPAPDPHVTGLQAHVNYEAGQHGHIDRLFHEYGKLPIDARVPPKVNHGGVENFVRAQGDAVRKIITQCPPSNRYLERPQSVPAWP